MEEKDMPDNKYRKPKENVIQVFRGKELVGILQNALQITFDPDGIKVTSQGIQRLLDLIQKSVGGGKVVLIVEQYPLNSEQVRGQHKNFVFQVINKTGNQYTRRFTKSGNPRTPLQQAHRMKYKEAVLAWNTLPVPDKQLYNQKAARMPLTGYNLFIRTYLATH